MVSNPDTTWTPGKDAFLRANHGETSNTIIAECLGCSLYALEQRIKQLELL